MRRWDLHLPIYFGLRMQQICMPVETLMSGEDAWKPWKPSSASASQPSEPSLQLQCLTTRAVWRALRSCWARSVFIPELASRFLRLNLQLCRRTSSWLLGLCDHAAPGVTVAALWLLHTDTERLARAVDTRLAAEASRLVASAGTDAVAGDLCKRAFATAAADLRSTLAALSSAVCDRVRLLPLPMSSCC